MRRSRDDNHPKTAKKNADWLLSRKQFLGSVIAGGLISQLPFSNVIAQTKASSKINLLSNEQLEILQSVQDILFPSDGDGPGASDINATDYLVWVLSDSNKDADEIKYIINGIGWMDETAEEQYSKKYFDLSQTEREELVKLVSKAGWGESWLSVILSFIFEALLSDPQYGGNTHSTGWNWLKHYPGQPRPTDKLLYPEIIDTVRQI